MIVDKKKKKESLDVKIIKDIFKKIILFLNFLFKKISPKLKKIYKNPLVILYTKIIIYIILILIVANKVPLVRKKKKEFLIKNISNKINSKCNVESGYSTHPNKCKDLGFIKYIYTLVKSKYKMKTLDSLPVLHLNIKQKRFIEIKKLRDEVLSEGRKIEKKTKVWFPARILYNNKIYKVKIRLKGDIIDHLDHEDKWSFRIKVKKGNTIGGYSIFSIHHPKTRAYLDDLFYSEMMQKNKILSPKIHFAKVYINGQDIGIMQVEEFFSKELLELQGKKEGIIFKANDRFIKNIDLVQKKGNFKLLKKRALGKFMDRDIHVLFPKNYNINNNDLKNLNALFEGFKNGKIKLNQIFNLNYLAKYYAITQIIGTNSNVDYYHGLMFHNTIMYYNPIIQKLEMISFDNNVTALDFSSTNITHPQNHDRGSDFIDIFFADKEFRVLFKKYIIQISNEILNTDKYDEIYSLINDYYYHVLKSEFYYLSPLNVEQFKKRVIFVRDYFLNKNKASEEEVKKEVKKEEKLDKKSWTKKDKKEIKEILKDLKFVLYSYDIKTKNQNKLKIVNIFNFPIKITKIYAANNNKKKDLESLKLINKELSFPMITKEKNIIFIDYARPSFKNYNIIIEAKVDGIDKTFKHKAIMNYALSATKNPIPTSTIRKQLQKHNFLSLKNKILRITQGVWDVDDYIIVPKGYILEVKKGTTLSFKYNKGIISYGNLIMNGTNKSPIVLKGQKNVHGTDKTWKGVAVLQANYNTDNKKKNKSVLNGVNIYNTSGMSHVNKNGSAWILTGSITFYDSDVKLNNVSIKNNYAEDALNIVNSNFIINNITIKNTTSDAFDSDFSNGKIVGGLFKNIGTKGGGDAIDFSGSKVDVEGTTFENINDKAVSVGENTKLTANNLIIKNTNIAFASKDGSNLIINNTVINNARFYGLMSYKKKSEYSNASIIANGIKFLNTEKKVKVQKGNSILLNGKKINPEDIDVEKLYETEMKKGK